MKRLGKDLATRGSWRRNPEVMCVGLQLEKMGSRIFGLTGIYNIRHMKSITTKITP